MNEQGISNTSQDTESGKQPRGNHPQSNAVDMGPRGRGFGSNLPDRQRDAGTTAGLPAEVRGTPASQEVNRGAEPPRPLEQMHKLIERAGEEAFPSDTIRILSEPINDSLVDVRPDGLIYVSHTHYRDRLDAAFGVGAWALVPLEAPKVSGNKVYYYGFLKARGQFIADAYGEAAYYPGNSNGSYGNSVESAKSDCLVRCCKALPMFRECWDKEYADYWVATYAEKGVTKQSQGKVVWKKKGEAMRDFTMRPDRQSQGEYYRAPRIQDENQAHIEAIASEGTLRLAARDEYNDNAEYYDDGREDA